MRDYADLRVWQLGHGLALAVYEATKGFPDDERYGLTSQLRRAAVSIPTNVAEGSGRRSNGEFRHFLSIAAGSASEVDYLLRLAAALGILDEGRAKTLRRSASDVRRMLHGFQRALDPDSPK